MVVVWDFFHQQYHWYLAWSTITSSPPPGIFPWVSWFTIFQSSSANSALWKKSRVDNHGTTWKAESLPNFWMFSSKLTYIICPDCPGCSHPIRPVNLFHCNCHETNTFRLGVLRQTCCEKCCGAPTLISTLLLCIGFPSSFVLHGCRINHEEIAIRWVTPG